MKSKFQGSKGLPLYLQSIAIVIFALSMSFIQGGGVIAAKEIGEIRIKLLVSRQIKPYVEAVKGIRETLDDQGTILETQFVEDYSSAALASLSEDLLQEPPSILISIGPETTHLVWTEFPNLSVPAIFCMVLNPDEILPRGKPPCGVSMSIPIPLQVQEISNRLPSVKTIGLLYDPVNNEAYYKEALSSAQSLGLKLASLEVDSRRKISDTIASHWNEIDALWLIPDRTVISESIVQYIAKEALLSGTPVIGYNRFFHESGALLSFVLDYQELGRQAGRLAAAYLNEGLCKIVPPHYQVWINDRVAEKLDVPVYPVSTTGSSLGR